MKKRFLSCFALIIMFSFVFLHFNTAVLSAQTGSSQTTSAVAGGYESKEEVVYALLDPSGAVSQIYMVNILNVATAGQISDYGSYTSVKNLTSTESLEVSEDRITSNAPSGRFYYQGNLSDTNLPWLIEATYTLDGSLISAADLPGKNGKLEIIVNTGKNPNVNSSFFDHYLLQAVITLDTQKCRNISALGATMANAGTNKLVTFTIMPGTEGKLMISADVSDFEMEGIQITAVPYSMNIELPDTSEYTDDLVLLSDAISELSDGINSVADGVAELNNGIGSLKTGSSDFNAGLKEISINSEDLLSGSREISGVLTAISKKLTDATSGSDLSSLAQLPTYLTTLSTGLLEISGGLTQLSTNYAQTYVALNSAIQSIPDTEISQSSLQNLMINNPGDETVSQLIEYYTAARTVKATYQKVSPAFEAVYTNLPTISSNIVTISDSLDTIATQLTSTFEKSDLLSSVTLLTQGITELAVNYETFHSGLQSYTGGVSQLTAAYRSINSGISELVDGTSELHSGMSDLNHGAKELDSQTTTMPEQMEATIDDLLSSYETPEFAPLSFVSEKNDKTISVQFIIRTDKIEKPEATSVEPEDEKTATFWSRLKNLFTGEK